LKKKSISNFVVSSGIGFILFGVVIAVFIDRLDGRAVESIDRFKFLNNFVIETKGWRLIDYIIGAPRLSPLSENVCDNLRYYSSLFSLSGDGSCYAVIFHSYILRAIFDHGVLGLLMLFYVVFYKLKISGYTQKDSLVFIAVLLLNGLSVSSFNSVYFVLVYVMFILTPLNTMQGSTYIESNYGLIKSKL